MIVTRSQAAAARREAFAATAGTTERSAPPRSAAPVGVGLARSLAFPAQPKLVTALTEREGRKFYRLEGYASTFNQPYEMWDMFGPYDEVVTVGAADKTLATNPDVAFLVNHKGLSMARTATGTLDLSADETGLRDVAWLNPERGDVKDLMAAIDDGNVTEQSFAFVIPDGGGAWSEDFETFEIREFDIHRGDVSAVNYGANPYTSIAARQREMMEDLARLPVGAARAALVRLGERADLKHAGARVPGPWVARVRAAMREQRALAPEDASFLNQVLGWLTSIDNIVDEGQESIADYLGVPNPDSDEVEDTTAAARAAGTGTREGGGRSLAHIEALLVDGE